MTQKVITVIKWEKKLKCSKLLFYESDEDLKKKKRQRIGERKKKQACVTVESVFIALFFSP